MKGTSVNNETKQCLIITLGVVVFFATLFVGISVWVQIGGHNSVLKTEARAHACQQAPKTQIAACLKLNP